MSLMKIEEGLVGSSKTLYHAKVVKLTKEEKELNKKHEAAKQLRLKRRAEQKANVEAKQRKKKERKERRAAAKANGETLEDESSDDEENSEENSDAIEGYDSELFSE